MTNPPLVQQFSRYLNDVETFRNTQTIDLSRVDFIYPTRLVLICNILLKNPNVTYIPPSDTLVERYVDTIISNVDIGTRTYIPLVRLPPDITQGAGRLERVYAIQETNKSVFGGEDAFKYVVGELVDNMYQHSNFTNGLIMGQKYPSKHFVELCFFDDGITIPQSFVNSGLTMKPHEAIAHAINGSSTVDPKRGYGLSTSARIFLEGLKGQVFVASGGGAVYLGDGDKQSYSLTGNSMLEGTLVSLRIPYPSPIIDIYKYIE